MATRDKSGDVMRGTKAVRRLLSAVAGMLVVGIITAGPAMADGVVHWTGKGTDSVGPCEPGEDPVFHWVFTTGGNDTVTAAVLTVNGTDYPMSQSGQGGSWSADVPGTDPATTTAFVTYTGDLGRGNANLVISHGCFEGPTYPPTTPPTNPPTTPPSKVEAAVVEQGGKPGKGGNPAGVLGAAESRGETGALAFTGAEWTLLVGGLTILLAGGAVALIAGRRRAAKSD
jgi:hypothetical protein